VENIAKEVEAYLTKMNAFTM